MNNDLIKKDYFKKINLIQNIMNIIIIRIKLLLVIKNLIL